MGQNALRESLPSGSSSFLVIDFADYESQTTVYGQPPAWDFAASYKVFIDDFFLRYLATDVVRAIELNTTQGEFICWHVRYTSVCTA